MAAWPPITLTLRRSSIDLGFTGRLGLGLAQAARQPQSMPTIFALLTLCTTSVAQSSVFIEPTCALCTVGSYASLSVCPSVCPSGLDQKSLDNNSYLEKY